MDSYFSIVIVLLVISIILSFEFTMIESAFLSITQFEIEGYKEKSEQIYKIVKDLSKSDKLFSTVLVFDYFANSLVSILIGLILFSKHSFKGLVIAGFLAPFIIIVLGEIVPKSIGKQKYKKIIFKRAKALSFLTSIFSPFVKFLKFISKGLIRVVGGSKNYKEPLMTRYELIDAVSLGIEEGIINEEESMFIENVMDFKELMAKDAMTARTDMVTLDIDSSYEEIVDVVKSEAFSRMPVYEEDLDNIVGILHVKDLISFEKGELLKDKIDILKPVLYTYEFKPIGKLFNEMRRNKTSVAIVNDEFGGTEGMVTMEDLVEKIVGSISDEYDEDEDEDFIKIGKNEYIINGSMNLDDFNHAFNTNLFSEEIDSIAGYIIEKIDRFPKTGEKLLIDNLNFTISSSKRNRIEKLILKL
ncbi:hemolysin family protein [Peptoniphilus catoniae]|uniref:hemolysin family protein n=1 Tax=Peptoniphilus catoniae TaxID=1660341 RepID=UPI0010FDB5CB|nr:hemolysin family protein [Peptoniphilus catoniae]